ncbi:hypothetical protein EV666_11569 [Camelimonas lactis]|uniref:Uncharacterized protein n=2 Tax=Camelimonas lactis TaxID=659006 RepID=A0A4R2GM55_9HYPH|nr:hypothetical protein EV666_11569 [Camelimonas lactis]
MLACVCAPAVAEAPPQGSYMASCKEIRVVAGWLRAACQDRKGRWVEATTAVSWRALGGGISPTTMAGRCAADGRSGDRPLPERRRRAWDGRAGARPARVRGVRLSPAA